MPMSIIQRFESNSIGRDFAVGDIHGCFEMLEAALFSVGFNKSVDRLFSVGDLVGRGPHSERALAYLAEPWFFAVRGDHEKEILAFGDGARSSQHMAKIGASWFGALTMDQQNAFFNAFAELPYVIEIGNGSRTVGVVHGGCPISSWAEFVSILPAEQTRQHESRWARDRIGECDTKPVEGIRAVIAGATPLSAPVVLGNSYYIDTAAAFKRGYLTLCEISTLALHPMVVRTERAAAPE